MRQLPRFTRAVGRCAVVALVIAGVLLVGCEAHKTTEIPGAPAISTANLPDATVGVAYTANVVFAGGVAPLTLAIVDGTTLPPGLSIDAAGEITGTPTQGGAFDVVVIVRDSYVTPRSATRHFVLTIIDPTLTVTPNALPAAVMGEAFTANLGVVGGVAPYTFTVSAGGTAVGNGDFTLDGTGLTLAADGSISGTTATVADEFVHTFTVTVADSSTPAIQTAANFALFVTRPPTIATTHLPRAQVAVPFHESLAVNGGLGAGPFTWALQAGADLPSGLQLLPNGAITGAPTEAGLFEIDVQVTTASSPAQTAYGTVELVVYAPNTYTHAPDRFDNPDNNTAATATDLGNLSAAAALVEGEPLSVSGGSDAGDYYRSLLGDFWLKAGERRWFDPGDANGNGALHLSYFEAMVNAPLEGYTNGAIWVIGGQILAGSWLDSVRILHTDASDPLVVPANAVGKFEDLPAQALPEARRNLSAVFVQHSYGGYIYVIGGELAVAGGGMPHLGGPFTNSVIRLQVADAVGDPLPRAALGSWQAVADLPNTVMVGGHPVTVQGWGDYGLCADDQPADANDRIYLVSGRWDQGSAMAPAKVSHARVLMFEAPVSAIGTGTWHIKADEIATARRFPGIGMIDGRIYLGAGRSGAGNVTSIEMVELDPTGTNAAFSTADGSQFPALRDAVYFPLAAVLNGSLIMVGGWDNSLNAVSSAHRFTPAAGGTGGVVEALDDADVATGFGPGVAHDGRFYAATGVTHGTGDSTAILRFTPRD